MGVEIARPSLIKRSNTDYSVDVASDQGFQNAEASRLIPASGALVAAIETKF